MINVTTCLPFLKYAPIVKRKLARINLRVDESSRYTTTKREMNIPDHVIDDIWKMVGSFRLPLIHVMPNDVYLYNGNDERLNVILNVHYTEDRFIDALISEVDYSAVANNIEFSNNESIAIYKGSYVDPMRQEIDTTQYIIDARNGSASNGFIVVDNYSFADVDGIYENKKQPVIKLAPVNEDLSDVFGNIGTDYNRSVQSSTTPYSDMIERYLKSTSPTEKIPLLVGMSGVAKSAIVKSLTEKLGMRMVDLRVSFMSRLDIDGLCEVVGKETGNPVSINSPMVEFITCTDEYLEFARKSVTAIENKLSDSTLTDDDRSQLEVALGKFREMSKTPVLFFDEISRSDRSIRGALTTIINQRLYNKYHLNEARMIAATNAPVGYEDDEDMQDIFIGATLEDVAVLDRFNRVVVRPEEVFNNWISWGKDNLHPDVFNYVKLDPGLAYDMAPLEDFAHSSDTREDDVIPPYPTYRAWENVSNYLKALDARGERGYNPAILDGLLGPSASSNFASAMHKVGWYDKTKGKGNASTAAPDIVNDEAGLAKLVDNAAAEHLAKYAADVAPLIKDLIKFAILHYTKDTPEEVIVHSLPAYIYYNDVQTDICMGIIKSVVNRLDVIDAQQSITISPPTPIKYVLSKTGAHQLVRHAVSELQPRQFHGFALGLCELVSQHGLHRYRLSDWDELKSILPNTGVTNVDDIGYYELYKSIVDYEFFDNKDYFVGQSDKNYNIMMAELGLGPAVHEASLKLDSSEYYAYSQWLERVALYRPEDADYYTSDAGIDLALSSYTNAQQQQRIKELIKKQALIYKACARSIVRAYTIYDIINDNSDNRQLFNEDVYSDVANYELAYKSLFTYITTGAELDAGTIPNQVLNNSIDGNLVTANSTSDPGSIDSSSGIGKDIVLAVRNYSKDLHPYWSQINVETDFLRYHHDEITAIELGINNYGNDRTVSLADYAKLYTNNPAIVSIITKLLELKYQDVKILADIQREISATLETKLPEYLPHYVTYIASAITRDLVAQGSVDFTKLNYDYPDSPSLSEMLQDVDLANIGNVPSLLSQYQLKVAGDAATATTSTDSTSQAVQSMLATLSPDVRPRVESVLRIIHDPSYGGLEYDNDILNNSALVGAGNCLLHSPWYDDSTTSEFIKGHTRGLSFDAVNLVTRMIDPLSQDPNYVIADPTVLNALIQIDIKDYLDPANKSPFDLPDPMTDFIADSLDAGLPTMIMSVSGLGKTTRVKEYCEKNGYNFELIALSTKDRLDVMGPPAKLDFINYISKESSGVIDRVGLTRELNQFKNDIGLPPSLTVRSPDGILRDRIQKSAASGRPLVVLFDEFNRCIDPTVQSAIFQAISDNMIGGVKFDPGMVKIVMAGNLGESTNEAGGVDAALTARAVQYKKMQYDDDDAKAVLNYMRTHNYAQALLDFIGTDYERVKEWIRSVDDGSLVNNVSSTRSLHALSDMLKESTDSKLLHGAILCPSDDDRQNFSLNSYDYDNVLKVVNSILAHCDNWAALESYEYPGGVPLDQAVATFKQAADIFKNNPDIRDHYNNDGTEASTFYQKFVGMIQNLLLVDSAVVQYREKTIGYYIDESLAHQFVSYYNTVSGVNTVAVSIDDLVDRSLITAYIENRFRRLDPVSPKWHKIVIEIYDKYLSTYTSGDYVNVIGTCISKDVSKENSREEMKSLLGYAPMVDVIANAESDTTLYITYVGQVVKLLGYTQREYDDTINYAASVTKGVY